jgi:predicted SprT family Zn-dependent metalloprotease
MRERSGFPKDLYEYWNRRFFRGRLPDIPVYWSKTEYSSGRRKSKMGSTWLNHETKKPVKITLNPKYRDARAIWQGTLLHEMVHVQQWRVPEKQAHGRKFHKRMKQLAAAGAFNAFW